MSLHCGWGGPRPRQRIAIDQSSRSGPSTAWEVGSLSASFSFLSLMWSHVPRRGVLEDSGGKETPSHTHEEEEHTGYWWGVARGEVTHNVSMGAQQILSTRVEASRGQAQDGAWWRSCVVWECVGGQVQGTKGWGHEHMTMQERYAGGERGEY